MASTSSPAAEGRRTQRPSRALRRGVARRAVRYGLVVAAAGVLTACGSTAASTGSGGASGAGRPAASGQRAAAHGMLLSTRNLSGLGEVLVDSSGRTVYTPKQEADGTIKCTGGCLSFWFPVTVRQGATLSAASGVSGKLGEIHRTDDGVTQLTYDGKPLYTFHLDQAPGQAKGNNFTDSFGGVTFNWHALFPSGSPATQSNPGGSGGSGGSGGYNSGGSGY